jgi:hypothetical protein
MKDKNKILAGFIVFIAIFTLPFWFNMGKAAPAPELELTESQGRRRLRDAHRIHEGRAHAAAGCVARQRWSETVSGYSSTPKARSST